MTENNSKTPEKFSWGQPLSLLQTCISFVGNNLDMVESFHNFPSLLGKEIFSSAERCEHFAVPEAHIIDRLKLFSSAFAEEFLENLCLSQCHLLVNYLSEDFLIFSGVTSLDLSCCGLGDDHELLYQLSHFTNLKVLSLRDNALTCSGVQKFTLPLRMFKQGPKMLEALDLSENPDLIERSIKYLKVYPHLKVLNLSHTAIKKTGAFLLPSELNSLILETETNNCTNDFEISTSGWATNVINSWSTWYNKRVKRPRLGENSYFPKVRLSIRVILKCFSKKDSRRRLKHRITSHNTEKHYLKPAEKLILRKKFCEE